MRYFPCMTLFLANFAPVFQVVWSWHYWLYAILQVHLLIPLPLLLFTHYFPLSHLLTCYSSSLPSLYIPPLVIPTFFSYLATFPTCRYSTMASSSRLQERTGRMPKSPSPLPNPASGALHLLCLHESSALRDLHHASCLLWHYQKVVVAIMIFNLMNTIQPSKTSMKMAMFKMNSELLTNIKIVFQPRRWESVLDLV